MTTPEIKRHRRLNINHQKQKKYIFNFVPFLNNDKYHIFVRTNIIDILPMAKKIFILCVFAISSCGIINAQDWSKEDSLWLINILEGKQELKINEDTKKAIEDGRLIIPSWMKNDDGQIYDIEILKDLNAGQPDSTKVQNIDPYSMPPAVFALYVLYMDKMDSIYQNSALVLSTEDKKKLEEALPASARYKLYYNEYGGGIGGYDFNHILSMLFHPTYRRKMHNRKHATAYKNYISTDEVRTMTLSERERRELNRAVKNVKSSVFNVNVTGVKRNGIDD